MSRLLLGRLPGNSFAVQGGRVRLGVGRPIRFALPSKWFAFHQRFGGLGEGIGNGKAVLAVVAVDCGHGDDEVDGNQTRALVQKLEVGMLAVDAFIAEQCRQWCRKRVGRLKYAVCRGFPYRAG